MDWQWRRMQRQPAPLSERRSLVVTPGIGAPHQSRSHTLAQRQRLVAASHSFKLMLKDLGDGRESEMPEQAVKFHLHVAEAAVLAHSGLQAGWEGRLQRIDLPGVEVEDRGAIMREPRQSTAAVTVRQKTQI